MKGSCHMGTLRKDSSLLRYVEKRLEREIYQGMGEMGCLTDHENLY
jgi:hypothetical protein